MDMSSHLWDDRNSDEELYSDIDSDSCDRRSDPGDAPPPPPRMPSVEEATAEAAPKAAEEAARVADKKVTRERAVQIVDKAAQKASDVIPATQFPMKKPKQLKAAVKEEVVKLVESGDPGKVVQYMKDHREEFISEVFMSWFMHSVRAQVAAEEGEKKKDKKEKRKRDSDDEDAELKEEKEEKKKKKEKKKADSDEEEERAAKPKTAAGPVVSDKRGFNFYKEKDAVKNMDAAKVSTCSTHTRARTHTHAHACTRMHTHAHACTRMHTHTHAQTRSHTHTHRAGGKYRLQSGARRTI